MSKIKIVPLGGLRENGKNMYVTEIGEDIFVLDCGLLYPEGELFGIDQDEFAGKATNAIRALQS